MSKSITIRAADSAQAMDEVARRLGPDALILSSSRKDGQFEIIAMVEGEPEVAEADKPALADRLKKALKASPFAVAQGNAPAEEKEAVATKEAVARKPADVAANSPVGMTSTATFEALLKRRLEEDGVATELSPDAAAVKAISDRAAAKKAEDKALATSQVKSATKAPSAAERLEQAKQEAVQKAAAKSEVKKVPLQQQAKTDAKRDTSQDVKASPQPRLAGTVAAEAAKAAPVSAAPLPDDGIEYAPRVAGLGGFDIPTPVLPQNVANALCEDLRHYDRTGHLIGLTQAIVSSLLPERVTDPLGVSRFFVAGPDMRQKALVAMRVAIRKLDAGEAKPSFYVMGQEARADAAFLASKAELLGLNVMLVDEKVGRLLPEAGDGAQIVILPDNPGIAKGYADEFMATGGQGLFVLPSVFSRDLAANMLTPWQDCDVQVFMAANPYAPVSAPLLACLLQFNKQVAWASEGEDVLDNLTQADEVIVSDWMRAWVREQMDAQAVTPAEAAFAAKAADMQGSAALPLQ
jgi:hypothetical protein